MSKRLSKYIAAFGYIDKILIVFLHHHIISFTSVIGIPAGLASANFTLVFSLATEIMKKLLKVTRNKNRKHNKVVMLAKSKLNSIETLMSLIDLKKSHEEFKTIVNENEKYEAMKESIRITKSRDKLSENSRDARENSRNA